MKVFYTFLHFVFLFLPVWAFASPTTITLQSRIAKPNGSPLESTSTNFRISITDPIGTCVLFVEDFLSINLSGTKGLATLTIGTGAPVYQGGGTTLKDIFDNSAASNFTCQGSGTYDPGLSDQRKLVMQFNDGLGWQTLPAMSVNSVPYALHASNSNALGGMLPTDFVQIANVPSCIAGQALHFNGTSFTCVAIAAGTGTVTSVTSSTSDISIATQTTTPVITLNVGVGANQIVKLTAGAELPAVSGVNLTAMNASNLGSGTIPLGRIPAFTGDVEVTAGTTTTSIVAGAIIDADINAAAGIARSKIATEGGAGPGNVLINDGSGNISSLQCGTNEIIKFNGAGVAGCSSDNAGTGDIVNGGNSGAVTVGTNDANSLTLETNNVAQVTVLSNGNVGIGTTAPTGTLDVRGGTATTTASGTSLTFIAQNGGPSGNTNGGSVIITAGNPNAAGTGAGGNITLTAGDHFGGLETGSITLQTRTGDPSGAINLVGAGGVNITSGLSYVGATDVNITAATTTGAAPGGAINLTGGSAGASNNVGGNITLNPGAKSGAASDGNIVLANLRGNVGIGTATPQRLLHVTGPMRISPSAAPIGATAGDMYVDSGDSNKLKIYDGSGWVSAGGSGGGGSVTSVTSANSDIGIADQTTTPVLTLNVGTGNNQIVKLNGSAQLPAVSGINLTALNASNIASGTLDAARLPAIENAQIAAAAGIVRTKIASGSNNHVVINDGSGVMSSEAQLAVSRGGTGLSSFANNALLMANGTGSGITNAVCGTIGDVLLWTGTTWACTNLSGSSQGYFRNSGNDVTGTATLGTNSAHSLQIETNDTVRMTIDSSGNVGIGTTSSGSKLEVAGDIRQTSGQISSVPFDNGSGTAFNFSNGNVQYTSSNCQAMTMSNMQDGGAYTIVVKGTVSGTCSFSHAGLNFHYSQPQGATANGSHSTYTFVRVGNDVYVTWIGLYF